jgi:DNA-binding transcriptional MerR regulator
MTQTIIVPITQAAKSLGVSSQTLRRWERHGHIPFPVQRDENNQRIYTSIQIDELALVKQKVRQRSSLQGGYFRHPSFR